MVRCGKQVEPKKWRVAVVFRQWREILLTTTERRGTSVLEIFELDGTGFVDFRELADAKFGRFERLSTGAEQRDAFLEELQAAFQRRVALFEVADDLLQLVERRLEFHGRFAAGRRLFATFLRHVPP